MEPIDINVHSRLPNGRPDQQALLRVHTPNPEQVMRNVLNRVADGFDPNNSVVTIQPGTPIPAQLGASTPRTFPAYSKVEAPAIQRQTYSIHSPRSIQQGAIPSYASQQVSYGQPSYSHQQATYISQQQTPTYAPQVNYQAANYQAANYQAANYQAAKYTQSVPMTTSTPVTTTTTQQGATIHHSTSHYQGREYLAQREALLSQPNIREIDGVVYEVSYAEKIVPRTEVQYLEKIVPRYEVQYVEKVVEIPEVQIIEELRAIPKVEVREWSIEVPYVDVEYVQVPKKVVQEQVQYVKRPEYQDVVQVVEVPKTVYVDRVQEYEEVVERPVYVPKKIQQQRQVEVIKHVPKVQVRAVEKIVEVPVYRDVQKPYNVDVAKPCYVFRDVPVPVVVAQRMVPVLCNEASEEAAVEVKRFVPYVVPVDVYIPRPVQLPYVMGKAEMKQHFVTGIPVAHWNGLVNRMNPAILQDQQLAQYMPYLREQDGTTPAIASPPLVEPIVPTQNILGYGDFLEYLKRLQVPSNCPPGSQVANGQAQNSQFPYLNNQLSGRPLSRM